MPLYRVIPELITITDHNLGDTSADQIKNGVPSPDPERFNTQGKLDDNGNRVPYVPGDRVSSDAGRMTTDVEGNIIEGENVYVYLADNGTGYVDATGVFQASDATNERPRSLTNGITHPDLEQDDRDNQYVTNPRNPFWAYERRINRLSFMDERPFIRTGRDDIDGSGEGLSLTLNCNRAGDTLGLMNTDFSRVSISFARLGSSQFSESVDLTDLASIQTVPQYFFRSIVFPRHYIFRNIPTFAHRLGFEGAERFRITMRNPGAKVQIGQIIFGKEVAIGEETLLSGIKINSLDRSTVGFDPFGVQERVPRPRTNTIAFNVRIKALEAEAVNRQLTALSGGKPTLFYQTLQPERGDILYGFTRNDSIKFSLKNDDAGDVSGTLIGLI